MIPDLFDGVDPGVQALIRAYCGWHVAPVITETVTVDGPGKDVLCLPTLHLLDLVDVLNDTTPVQPEWSQAGFARRVCWTGKLRGITATLTHGYDDCPLEVVAAGRRLTQTASMATGSSIRVGAVSISGGQVDSSSGIDPYCSAILDRYRLPGRP